MKILPYILALCCLLSCAKPADVTPLLERAERLMNAHPDSALTLLESLPNPEELSPPDRALWGLLLTQARDKNYVPHTSDSLISHSIEYFRTHDDVHRLAWSYYYDGMIHYELEEFELSQTALLQAEEAATKAEDFDLLGRVYENLGTIYRKQGLTELVLPMHRKALEAKQQVGDSLGIGLAYNNIGRYYLTHDLDSAETYFQQALSWLQSEPYQQSHVFNDLARVYRRKQDYEKALAFIKQSLALFENNAASVNPIYLNLADVYTQLGKTDSAIIYYQRCLLDAKTRTTAHKRLAVLYSQLGDYPKAYTYRVKYEHLLDSVYESEKATELAAQLEKHEKEKAIAQLKQAHDESLFLGWVVGMSIVITLLAIALILVEKNRRRKGELLRVSEEVLIAQQNYQQILSDKKLLDVNYQSVCNHLSLLKEHHATVKSHSEHLLRLNESIEFRLKEKEAEILNLTAQLAVQVDEFKHHNLMSSAVYRWLLPLMGQKREQKDYNFTLFEEQDWEYFYRQMDFVYDNFVTRLKDEYQLSGDSLKVACLSLLKVYPCNARFVYGTSVSAFTNRRNLLAEKLGISTGELDAFLQTFSEEKI